jgi:hypothetical protein
VRLGWRFRFLLFRKHNGRSLPLQAAARSNTQSRLGSRSRDIPSASTAQPLQNIRNNVRCCARLVLFHLQTPSIGKTLSPASHRAALPSYSCFISSSDSNATAEYRELASKRHTTSRSRSELDYFVELVVDRPETQLSLSASLSKNSRTMTVFGSRSRNI